MADDLRHYHEPAQKVLNKNPSSSARSNNAMSGRTELSLEISLWFNI
jgi:hypothetical protein